MVGRDAEWDALQASLAATVVGRGAAIGVIGPAGIGKSRLVDDFTRWARDDAAVFIGRCVEDGSPPALRPLTEALLSGLRAAPTPADADLEPFLPALSRVLPLWPTAPRPFDTSPIVLAEGIIRLLEAAAGGAPAILVVEDLQWADPDSLAVLEYIADNVALTRLLVVVTARAVPGSASTVLRRLATRGVVRQLVLRALTDEEMQSMAVACLGERPSPRLLELLRDRADGFPLLVEELLGADPSTPHTSVVPSTVAELTAAKMTSLDVRAQILVRTAAVLGVRFGWDMLASVVDHEPAGMIDALRAAVDADLVVELAEGGFAFRHALTRDAVLATTLQPERAIIARRAWEALKLGEGARDSAWCGQAAEFAAVAGEAEAAVTLLHTGARVDLKRGSLATAEATLQRARSLAVDAAQIVETDELLADVLIQQGRPIEGATVTATLLEGLGSLTNGSVRVAAARLRLARAWSAVGRWTDAAHETAAARAALPDPSLRPEADQVDAVIAFGREEFGRAEDFARAVLTSTARAGPWNLACEALELLGRLARRHDLSAAEDLFSQALRTAEQHDLPIWQLRALHELSTVDLLWSLDPGTAVRAGAEARRSGAVNLVAFSDFHRALMHCWRDEDDAASTLLDDCEHLCRSLQLPLLPMVLTIQALLAAKHIRRCDGLCDDALSASDGDPHVHAAVSHVHATRLLLAEDRRAALAALDPSMDSYRTRLETTSGPPLALWTLLATIERGDDALDHVTDLPGIRLSRWTTGYLGYAEAISLGRQGRPDDAQAAFAAAEGAMTHPAPMPHFRHLARRHVAEAAIHDGWGDPRRWLHEDEAHFRDNGHTTVATACRGLLRRIGEPVPRRTPGPPVPAALTGYNITGREMEVLQLLADGLTNREIAQRLVLSVRTVEKHIEHLLSKTGTTQRTQLVARAARSDW